MCFKENIPQAQSNFCLLPSLSLRHGGDGSCCQDCLLLLFSHIPRLRHRAAVERLSPSQPSIKGATFASGSQNTPSFSPSPTALRSSHPSNTAQVRMCLQPQGREVEKSDYWEQNLTLGQVDLTVLCLSFLFYQTGTLIPIIPIPQG